MNPYENEDRVEFLDSEDVWAERGPSLADREGFEMEFAAEDEDNCTNLCDC